MESNIVLIILFAGVLFYLFVSYLNGREGFQDSLYGQGSTSCQEECEQLHPSAARMDLDADNSIADHVMGECLKECQAAKGCTTCG